MNVIEQQYCNIVGNRLQQYKIQQSSPFRSNFRCPLCGDSKKNKHLKRAFFIENKGRIGFYCHNGCGGMSLNNFLKKVAPDLQHQYAVDKYIDKTQTIVQQEKLTVPSTSNTTIRVFDLKTIDMLDPHHPAVHYVLQRRIPSCFHSKLYYAPDFIKFVEMSERSINIIKVHKTKKHPRLIIPLITDKGIIFGFQGRAFGPETPKYYTFLFDPLYPKIYGADTIDFNKRFFCVEGPIDSMFVPNSVAFIGSDMNVLKRVNGFNKDNAVVVFDNQPRNKEIVGKISKTIDNGYSVVIWPSDESCKDINEMVISRGGEQHSIQQVNDIMNNNIFSGLEAKLKLNDWKR